MDIEVLQQEIRQFADERDWNQFHTPKNLVMALSVEASELLEEFQWLTPEQSEKLKQQDPERYQRVQDEMADVAVYLVRLADKLDIDLETAITQKMVKNRAKYPIEKAHGSAKKYTHYTD